MSRNHDEEDFDIPPSAPDVSKLKILMSDRVVSDKEAQAYVIPLDAGIESDLKWENAFRTADAIVAQEKKIVFSLELGLFDKLPHPISHQGQFQALALSCDHFRREAIPRYGNALIGAILYKGPLHMRAPKSHSLEFCLDNFQAWLNNKNIDDSPANPTDVSVSPLLRWYFRRFCHEQCVEFTRLLSLQIPDTVHRFILLDASEETSPYQTLMQASKDLLDPLHAVVQNSPYTHGGSVWNRGQDTGALFYEPDNDDTAYRHIDSDSLQIGLLLPSFQTTSRKHTQHFQEACEILAEKRYAPFLRIVHEPYFTSEWHELDAVIFSKSSLTQDGIRSLRGFEAAGGETLDIDQMGIHAICEYIAKKRS